MSNWKWHSRIQQGMGSGHNSNKGSKDLTGISDWNTSSHQSKDDVIGPIQSNRGTYPSSRHCRMEQYSLICYDKKSDVTTQTV